MLEEFERRIGYRFVRRELLIRALTHYSHVYDNLPSSPRSVADDNEQFEFLGDAVLGFVVSERLFRLLPQAAEGKLSQTRDLLITTSHLFETAQRIGIGAYLFLGRGEEKSGGRQKKSMLANAMEALIAAIYLDGGLEAAHRFIRDEIFPENVESLSPEPKPIDYKTKLQELTRSRKLSMPDYRVVGETGPIHATQFTVSVTVNRWTAEGSGTNKKSASQDAAKRVYEMMVAES